MLGPPEDVTRRLIAEFPRMGAPGAPAGRARPAGRLVLVGVDGEQLRLLGMPVRAFPGSGGDLVARWGLRPEPVGLVFGVFANEPEVWDLFDATVYLDVPADDLRRRLTTRTGNDYGKDLLRQHYETHSNDIARGHR